MEVEKEKILQVNSFLADHIRDYLFYFDILVTEKVVVHNEFQKLH